MNAHYTERDMKFATDISEIKSDVKNISNQVDNFFNDYKDFRKKVDSHGEELSSLKTKASLLGTIGGGVAAFIIRIFGGH